MIPVIILAGAAVIGAVVLAAFWKEIRAWLGKVWEKLPPVVKEQLQGAKAYLEKVESTMKNVFYYYSYDKEKQQWTETVVSREVSPQSIPEDILKKMNDRAKLDITSDVEQQLTLAA